MATKAEQFRYEQERNGPKKAPAKRRAPPRKLEPSTEPRERNRTVLEYVSRLRSQSPERRHAQR